MWRLIALGDVGAQAGLIVISVLIFQLFIRTFIMQMYQVPSGSMENTLKIGDVLVVSRLPPRLDTVDRGDIIVFRDPGGWLPQARARSSRGIDPIARSVLTFVGLIPENPDENLVKRVIGLPGDVLSCDDVGTLTVNGSPLAEPYLYPGDAACTFAFRVTVPSGSLWVMGDHRSDSADSRFHRDHNDGAVPISSVTGRVVAVLSNGSPSLL